MVGWGWAREVHALDESGTYLLPWLNGGKASGKLSPFRHTKLVRAADCPPILSMCLLILLRGVDPRFPLIIAGNRDEHRDRKAAPPGLFVGDHRRMLSPRDRTAAGTWMAVNDGGMFAGITNFAGDPERTLTTTRGELPHLALDQSDLAAAVAAVRTRCTAEEFNPFQLVIADRTEATVLVHSNGRVRELAVEDPTVVLTNEHRLGGLALPPVPDVAAPDLRLDERVERLQQLLRDEGALTGHRILKKGGEYGTVSSSIIAVPDRDIRGMSWWYAAGEPDTVPYRDYGNLAKRLGI